MRFKPLQHKIQNHFFIELITEAFFFKSKRNLKWKKIQDLVFDESQQVEFFL